MNVGKSAGRSTSASRIFQGWASISQAGLKLIWALLKEAVSQWQKDQAPRVGAALAFYTAFSLSPLLIIAIAIAGLVFGREGAQGQIVAQIQGLVGSEGAKAIQAMIQNARKPSSGVTSISFH
jgi:membrane protein